MLLEHVCVYHARALSFCFVERSVSYIYIERERERERERYTRAIHYCYEYHSSLSIEGKWLDVSDFRGEQRLQERDTNVYR